VFSTLRHPSRRAPVLPNGHSFARDAWRDERSKDKGTVEFRYRGQPHPELTKSCSLRPPAKTLTKITNQFAATVMALSQRALTAIVSRRGQRLQQGGVDEANIIFLAFRCACQ
jgi:hypothetical protein